MKVMLFGCFASPLAVSILGLSGDSADPNGAARLLPGQNTSENVSQNGGEYPIVVGLACLHALVAAALLCFLWPSSVAAQMPIETSSADHGACDPISPGSNTRPRIVSRLRILPITSLNVAYGFTLAVQGMLLCPLEAQRLWPDHSSMALGMFAALCGLSQLVGPEAGSWSDAWRSSYGRRRPMIILCVAMIATFTYVLWILSLKECRLLYATVFFLYQVVLTVMSAAQASLVPDCIPVAQRGFAGGISAANTLFGAMLGFVCSETLSELDYHKFYGLLYILTLTCCLFVCLSANEDSSEHINGEICHGEMGCWSRVVKPFTFDIEQHYGFALLMLTKTLYCTSVVVKGFILYFCQDTFRLPDPGSERALSAKVSISAEATASVGALLAMHFLDGGAERPTEDVTKALAMNGNTPQWRKMPRSLWAVVFGALWMGALWFGPFVVGLRIKEDFPAGGNPAAAAWSSFMVVGTATWGLGQGLYLAGDQALTYALLPDRENIARCMGLTSVCSFFGGVVGGCVVGGLLTLFGRLGTPPPSGYAFEGYAAIFVFASILSLAIVGIGWEMRKAFPCKARTHD
eukprot:TRINITY_DN36826_c0_g1_i1.p1 TRINITY_DN36826_c0_g1~~TRINITY_DN36826_c0_g1_i1.p1  ORF type:complete len:577 (-),score=61.75 TRINITY_DN36826_c0_g1_i1:76-1806(-)